MMLKIPWRGIATFTLGAVGFLHELLTKGTERPFILALSGALMGLPFVTSLDQWRAKPPPEESRRQETDDVEAKEDRWSHLP